MEWKMKPRLQYYDNKYFMFASGGADLWRTHKGRKIDLKTQTVLNIMNIQKNEKVLDIGCGRGELSYQCIKKRGKVTAIDFSKKALEFAEITFKNLSEYGKKYLEVHEMDARLLKFPDNTFDVVVMADIAEHMKKYELIISLQQIRKVLKPTGRLIIHTLPNKNLLNKANWVKYLSFGEVEVTPKGCEDVFVHLNELSPQDLTEMLTKCGFTAKVWADILNDNAQFNAIRGHKIIKWLLKWTGLMKWFGVSVFAIAHKDLNYERD
ncbi:methyltransferase domain-containing protein [Candidatus Woesearchaeota archaeon]|nr:methyltransferase domain-containing protein [Candidatus Woesearchaeota archaeon]